MKRFSPLIYLAIGAVIAFFLIPRKTVIKPIPQIVTVHDTVRDTVRLRGPRVVTTDTVHLIVRVTLHDTVQIPVNADSAQRPHLWPVLNAQIGKSRGDTSLTTTFSLRSGKTVESRIWTPGPLKSIWADSSGTPRMDFYPPMTQKTFGLVPKLLWSGIGFGVCRITK